MANFEKWFRAGSRVGLFIGVAFVMVIMVLTVANVVGRAFFESAIQGAYEISGLLLVVVAVFAMLYAAVEQANITIDIMIGRIPPRVREILGMFTSVIGLGVVVVILWATVDWLVGGAWRGKTQALGVLHLPFQIIWVSGLLLICLALLIDVYKALRKR